jgi:crotonobetainyl-CoA:carnitine CoA-transferase CaiB-like acyl-CoA transferase
LPTLLKKLKRFCRKPVVPSNVVEKPSDIYKDPQLASRKYFTEMEHATMANKNLKPRLLYSFQNTQGTQPSVTPGRQHNETVFKDFLNLTDDEIAEYLIDGSITTEFVGNINSSF